MIKSYFYLSRDVRRHLSWLFLPILTVSLSVQQPAPMMKPFARVDLTLKDVHYQIRVSLLHLITGEIDAGTKTARHLVIKLGRWNAPLNMMRW